jgi:hypothetical protein
MIDPRSPPLCPWGRRGQSEVGDARTPAEAHLTLPSRRDGSLPLPPMGGEGLTRLPEAAR